MGYRCANDMFNYCAGKPEWGRRPKSFGSDPYPGGGSCRLDPKFCGKYQTLSEQVGDKFDRMKLEKGTRKPEKVKKERKDVEKVQSGA